MARIHSNLVLHGVSGTLGGQLVVRRHRGGYILAAAPGRVTDRAATPKQKDQHERFRKAVLYGKATQGLPEYQALAASRGVSAYVVAVTDYLKPPEIQGIDVTAYSGAPGEMILVAAVDDVTVQTVVVQLSDKSGAVFEQGKATASSKDPHLWIYTATTKAPAQPVQVLVNAIDLAGQVTSQATHT
jgi:hypothetical protein